MGTENCFEIFEITSIRPFDKSIWLNVTHWITGGVYQN